MKPGETFCDSAAEVLGTLFQSAPGDEAGRNTVDQEELTCTVCFNPLPAMKPGGTRRALRATRPRSGFNPLPAMKPGGTRSLRVIDRQYSLFQSAPGDEAGRNFLLRSFQPASGCFNPLPAMKPGGTTPPPSPPPPLARFNPLPAMKPGGTRRTIAEFRRWSVSIRSRR